MNDQNINYIGEQLKALTAIASPTGFTKNVVSYVLEQLKVMGYEPQLSNKGNVSVTLGGEGSPLVLAAHVDTLGAMVRSIKDNGRLRPTTLGGHQWSTADGENCMVFTRDGRMYTGVVLMKMLTTRSRYRHWGYRPETSLPWIPEPSSHREDISRAVFWMTNFQQPYFWESLTL